MNQQNTSAPIAENKMGTMPVGRLVLNMSLPMMISMLVQALYNIVDSVFVAMLSENALTAVSMAFPLQTLLIAVGAGTGVGMNALLSKSLGEKNFKKANQAAENGQPGRFGNHAIWNSISKHSYDFFPWYVWPVFLRTRSRFYRKNYFQHDFSIMWCIH